MRLSSDSRLSLTVEEDGRKEVGLSRCIISICRYAAGLVVLQNLLVCFPMLQDSAVRQTCWNFINSYFLATLMFRNIYGCFCSCWMFTKTQELDIWLFWILQYLGHQESIWFPLLLLNRCYVYYYLLFASSFLKNLVGDNVFRSIFTMPRLHFSHDYQSHFYPYLYCVVRLS